jgi:gamma-glutamylputrescine oxidase
MRKAVKWIGVLSSVGGALVLAETWRRTQPSNRPEYFTSDQTYYRSTLKEEPPKRPKLDTTQDVDVCVIGGGFAGLATATGCVERGKSAVVLEQQKIGWGASGMNAGMALVGFQLEGLELVHKIGPEKAKKWFSMTLDARNLLRKRIQNFKIDCDVQDVGALTVSCYPQGEELERKETEEWNKLTNSHYEVWSTNQIREKYLTNFYHHGVFENISFAVNPLKLVLGLAKGAESIGVKIYENTAAQSISPMSNQKRRWKVKTENGQVFCDHVVLAGSAHLLPSLDFQISNSTVPVTTYIMVTEPLGDRMQTAIRAPHMVADDRYCLSYFRPLPDGRLLWGGLAQVVPVRHGDIAKALTENMIRVFPQLQGVKPQYVWGGTLAFTKSFLPLLGQRKPGLWYVTGFGGHGIIPTVLGGELISSGICMNDERWREFSDTVPISFMGGPIGGIIGQLTWYYYHLVDEYQLWKNKRL